MMCLLIRSVRVCVCVFCRDLAVIVASIAYNTWFTKLYCKDMRIVTEFLSFYSQTLSMLLLCVSFVTCA